ncbi:MAG TPA: ABC transporter substrate-binding protein [Solirubrobacteraceae bacterium]|nr:ABC transporter substrate-binding protein [Solirubrobacteraceae bacterium]
MRRRLLAAALAVAAAATLAACGERTEPTAAPRQRPVSLMLDFFPNADHAGIYAAMANGSFAKAGIDLHVQTPSDPASPLKLLEAGRVDLAISYEPELLLARERGAKLVSVGAIVQKPLTSIIAIKGSKVHSAASLAHKTVGTAGIPYQSAYLHTIEDHAGVPPSSVKEVNVGFNLVPAMLSKRVDATLGGFWNYEGVQLRLAHKSPTIIRMENAGVPTYDELIVVARVATAHDHGEMIRRFMQALSEGYRALKANPQAGVQPLLKANKDLDPKLQLASVRATLPVFFPADSSKPFGWMGPAQWDAYGRWLFRNGILKQPPDAAGAMTDEFLPGQGSQSQPAQ